MNSLLENQLKDSRSRDAVKLFCYAIKKQIGSFSAVLGGLDMLVFTGGIGENSPAIRTRICKGLKFLGIEVDIIRNAINAPVISAVKKAVIVRVIPANEELMMARIAEEMMKGN